MYWHVRYEAHGGVRGRWLYEAVSVLVALIDMYWHVRYAAHGAVRGRWYAAVSVLVALTGYQLSVGACEKRLRPSSGHVLSKIWTVMYNVSSNLFPISNEENSLLWERGFIIVQIYICIFAKLCGDRTAFLSLSKSLYDKLSIVISKFERQQKSG